MVICTYRLDYVVRSQLRDFDVNLGPFLILKCSIIYCLCIIEYLLCTDV